MKSLIQTSFGSTTEFTIKPKKLFIKEKKWNNSFEYSVQFELIGFDKVRKQTKGILLLIPLFLAFTGLELYVLIDEYGNGVRFPRLLIFIGAVIFFGVLTVMSFFQKKDEIILIGGTREIKLAGKNPNSQTVEDFIKSLHQAMRNHYKKVYASIDVALTDEENIQNFKWLKTIEVIDDHEYETLIKEVQLRGLIN